MLILLFRSVAYQSFTNDFNKHERFLTSLPTSKLQVLVKLYSIAQNIHLDLKKEAQMIFIDFDT